MEIEARIDTQSLDEDQAEALKALVAACKLAALPDEKTRASAPADDFHYQITIKDEAEEYNIETSYGAASDEVRALARKLTLLGRSTRNA